jgi:RNA polymerase sigma-32 factor
MTKKELKDRQLELFQRYKEGGDRKAHAELVETFRGLVYQLSARMHMSGIPRDDLVSEAFVGVCEAIEKFDPDRGDIVGVVYRAICSRLDLLSRDMSRSVSAPRSRREAKMRWHLSRKVQEYENAGFSQARAIELAAKFLGVSTDHAASNLAMRNAVSLSFSSDEDESRQFEDDAQHVEESINAERVREILDEAMNGLDERERYILTERLKDDRPSLDSLSEHLRIPRNRVSKIEKDAMEHVRIELKCRGLSAEDLL